MKKREEPKQPGYRLGAPRILKAGKIEPTTCWHCGTVYQAKRRHLVNEYDISTCPPRTVSYTWCPFCTNANPVTFAVEEVGER